MFISSNEKNVTVLFRSNWKSLAVFCIFFWRNHWLSEIGCGEISVKYSKCILNPKITCLFYFESFVIIWHYFYSFWAENPHICTIILFVVATESSWIFISFEDLDMVELQVKQRRLWFTVGLQRHRLLGQARVFTPSSREVRILPRLKAS